MNYKINLEEFRSMFAVPSSVVDKHIKLAAATQLKVLLWILKSGPDDSTPEQLSDRLGCAAQDISDALIYWENAGILLSEKADSSKKAEDTDITAEKVVPKAVAKPVKPTREEIAARGTESPEIAYLLNQAQMKFGRMLRQSEASTLVWLHDDEGIPIAVLLMLIEYAANEKSCNIGFIERTAVSWVNEGISDVVRAERRIIEMRAEKVAWRQVEKALGLEHRQPSAKEQQLALRWVNQWGFSGEMLKLAYDQCIDNTAKFSVGYINKILENWNKSEIHNPKQLEKYNQESKIRKIDTGSSDASYDINLIEQMLFGGEKK